MYDYESIIMDCHTCAEIGCGRRECSHKDADGCEAQLLIDAACAIDELSVVVESYRRRVQLGADWISVKKSPPKEYSTPLREKCGLPPVSDTVLITLIDPDVVDGKKDPYKGDRVVIADRFSNGELVQHKMLASQKTRPIAWMPLPEAPKEVLPNGDV